MSRLFLPLCVALGLLAGCATGTISIKMPISGGDIVPLELGKGGFVHAENDDFKIEKALIVLDGKTKQGTFSAEFLAKTGRTPQSVEVVDVSDDTPKPFTTDTHPTLNKDQKWTWQSDPFTPDPANAKWLFEIENSVRVYRFTIVTSDGRRLVMYEGASYPAFIKTYIRKQMGLEDEPKPAAPAAP